MRISPYSYCLFDHDVKGLLTLQGYLLRCAPMMFILLRTYNDIYAGALENSPISELLFSSCSSLICMVCQTATLVQYIFSSS
jgi:hypothetical protein